MIGVPCSDTGRYSAFSESLAALDKHGSDVKFAVSTWRHKARNELVRWTLESGDPWLLMVDDDQVFAPNLLERLLSHEKDIVAALCLRRDEPYGPFCFSGVENGAFHPVDLQEHGPEDLISVAAVGTGAMLIRSEVLKKMGEDPFWINHLHGEDMLFCLDAAAAGFEIYCDLGARIGHLTTTAVWPLHVEEKWATGFLISDETWILRKPTSDLTPYEA